ncbi:alpha-glucan family phosphorylase [Candidatus Igneacidithiobacillus taiwanensis]|uniref:alpha-glucan family phosphorylase n=1 Tax=Candidatus Igneacidithiobacillus taiwanensis TaxID=1945924 RepID=UPI0028A2C2CD|nr:alpha-glucan family phosphorylase [Candidatus Igneacidithiobacillus taiwanensis]
MNPTLCYMLPKLPNSLSGLAELATDLRWSWNHAHDVLWEQIDPDAWRELRSPWLLLQNLSEGRLRSLARNRKVTQLLANLLKEHRSSLTRPTWFQQEHADAPFSQIAYFSMEFGLSEALPIYSGGLGILAGDVLKTAHDLGVPITGVGILWQQGYFRQTIDAQGRQSEQFPFNDPTQLPVTPALDADGEWIRVTLPLPGRTLILRAWQAQIGRVSLYLLDSNDPFNAPTDRSITGELYGGGSENRLLQEICLGIGGWQLLQKLGLQPDLCHLNEGHAAFAVLARARSYLEQHGGSLQTALIATRVGNIFTTHTPIAAGFDRFAADLMNHYLERAPDLFGLDAHDVLSLGRTTPTDAQEPFNMAWLALRGSGMINGVSQLHGEVSRAIFQPLFPRWPQSEVPVTFVTNGVHMPSWDSREADALWSTYAGKARWIHALETMEEDLRKVPDTELWNMRNAARADLVRFARAHLKRRLSMAQAPAEQITRAEQVLDPNRFTMGFARRFTEYKRPNLLLHDADRLYRLLTNTQFPVQLVLAGKAHPADEPGKLMIQEWTQFIERHPELFEHIVFLDDYDMLIAGHLVRGVDLWINTPRRPWEASGTSGMKVLVNGGLNVSELDGWWAEAYEPAVGWALGDRQEHGTDLEWDHQEAERLYTLLEQEILPDFYDRHGPNACPQSWIYRMRESMARLTPQYSSNRMMREYVSQLYLPAAQHLQARQSPEVCAALAAWQSLINQHWNDVRFLGVESEQTSAGVRFSVTVQLGAIPPEFLRVELFATGSSEEIHPMTTSPKKNDSDTSWTYAATIQTSRAPADYTPRIIPCHPHAIIPLECNHILWYR